MRKIQVFPALQRSLKLIANNWQVVAKFALPWLALVATFNASLWLTKNDVTSISPLVLISYAVGYIAASSIAVSWHRYILFDEIPSHFRIDKLVWTFAFRTLFIGLICVIPLLAAAQLFERLPSFFLPLWLAISLYILIIFSRLSISAVATAIGKEPFGLQNAIAVTKGNNWPLLGLVLSNTLMVFIAILAYAIISSLVQTIAPALGRPVTLLLSIPMQFIVMLLNAALQTTLYGYFVEGRDLH